MDNNESIERKQEAKLEEMLRLWEEMGQVDREKAWKRIDAELSGKQFRRIRRRNLRWLAVAGVMVLMIGALEWHRMTRDEGREGQAVTTCENQPRIQLESGEEILLTGRDAEPEMESTAFVIDRAKKSVVYSGEDSLQEGRLEYNVMKIPRGAEYELILADGTHVWLNADTRLRYPVRFGKEERRVFLEGEAYFEVARDTSRPFQVESSVQTVEVSGTCFNVYAYKEENEVHTTLIEGQVTVNVAVSGKRVKLKPGQRAILRIGQGAVKVEEVNITQVLDWKNGMFVFDDQTLETILQKVARWYDVEIFYKNDRVKTLVFKGNLPRYGELPELLKVLESGSYVNFELKGKALTVE